jgi:hypothetical protein
VTRREVVLEQTSLLGRRTLGHEVRRERHVNIDGPEDWAAAEAIAAALAGLPR